MKNFAIALLLSALSFQASATVVTTRADWNAATVVAKTLDFEGIASPGIYIGRGSSYANNGIIFTGGDLYSMTSGYAGGQLVTGTGDALFENSSRGALITINLGGAYNAFALDLRGYMGVAQTFTIRLSDAQTFNVTSGASAAFFGVTLDHTITSLSIQSTTYSALDNLSVGAARAAVPEPASAALLGLGLLGLALARRKSVK